MIQKQVFQKNRSKIMEQKLEATVEKIKIDEKIQIDFEEKSSIIEEAKEEEVLFTPTLIDVNKMLAGNLSMEKSDSGGSFLNQLEKEAQIENDILGDINNMSMLKMDDKPPEDEMAFDQPIHFNQFEIDDSKKDEPSSEICHI